MERGIQANISVGEAGRRGSLTIFHMGPGRQDEAQRPDSVP